MLARMSLKVLRRSFVLLLVVAASLETVAARVGWTIEECVKHYGKFGSYDEKLNAYTFRVGDVVAYAYFVHGLVGMMGYQKADRSHFTDEEINVLLRKNGGERQLRAPA